MTGGAICNVISGRRREASNATTRTVSTVGKDSKSTVVGHVARSEMDNHADTTCFGSNFRLMYYTNKVCDVTPFSEAYSAMTNVPIVGACTGWIDPESGRPSEYRQRTPTLPTL